jgi:hypothetical protein
MGIVCVGKNTEVALDFASLLIMLFKSKLLCGHLVALLHSGHDLTHQFHIHQLHRPWYAKPSGLYTVSDLTASLSLC